jgi:ribosome-associated toxin RatA of RatAB toxin-antitoxin module
MRFQLGFATMALLLSGPFAAGAQTVSPPAAAPTDAAPAPSAPTLEVEQVPVPGTTIQAGRVTAEVQAPFEVVAAVLTDFAHYHEFLPQVDQSRVVQRRRGQVDLYLQARLRNSTSVLWSLARFTVRRTPGSLVIEGGAVQGNLSRLEVRFEATAVPGSPRTRVVMQLLGIPTFPLPEGLLSSQQSRWAVRGMEALRARAERTAAATRTNPAVREGSSAPAR